MDANQIEKGTKLNKELTILEEMSTKFKIFNFYFYVLRKKDINMFLYGILFFLETVQIISYAFTSPHTDNWGISENTMSKIQLIVGAPRITPLMKFVRFKIYLVIYSVILVYIFIHCLIITMIIKFNKTQSKFYQLGVGFTRYFTSPLTIFLMIPLSELILLPIKCVDNKIDIIQDSVKCWNSLHYLYVALGIVFTIIFFAFIYFSTIFYFEPFNSKKTTSKLDTSADMLFYFFKMVAVIRFISIKNQYISIFLMVILSVFNLKRGLEIPTYNNLELECIVTIRNGAICWTFLILLVSKISAGTNIIGLIYLLIFGYPLIVAIGIIYYRKKSQTFMITTTSFNNLNQYIARMRYMTKLVESYFDKTKSGKTSKNDSCKKNEIILKGIISIHEELCVTEECPLKKFEENNNNFAAQKTSLLHYMNNLFLEGIKKFPNSRLLYMLFVQFNYDKKYNLNAAKTYLTKLEKQKNSLTDDYIVYSIKQSFSSVNNKPNSGMNDNEEMLRIEDTTEQKYKRLKFLVESTVKLYSEFWGILAANITNNLNTNKLFLIGNKLNRFLNEINLLWENDLKNKKIDLENQSTAQLYAYFLREIAKNKKRSDEITKKLNEEQHYESKKNDNEKFDIENLDILLENQDYVLYCRTNEKGECDIIQCSNSIVNLLCYTKQEIIGKHIEALMPAIFIPDHAAKLANSVRQMKSNIAAHKDNIRGGEQKNTFILPKTKVGFLIPINAKFTLFNDDDFSNTYIINAKLEAKDTKSIYAFYVLTNSDFTVDSISSSAINLGLSMDLLKKYVIHMELLVRSEKKKEKIPLAEKWQDFEEDPKRITWIYPDKIYPKDDSQRNNEENIDKLIKESNSKEYMLYISQMKYSDEEPLGYCFKFTKTDDLKNNVDLADFKTNKNAEIMFDLLRLSYVRTKLVREKSQNYIDLRPSREISSQNINEEKQIATKTEKKKKKKIKDGINNLANSSVGNTASDDDLSDDYDDNQNQIVLLTKEKIAELQNRSLEEIKSFIEELPYYGSDVSLEKHRPNKERYSVGKQTEPEIKININQYENRIKERLKNDSAIKKAVKIKGEEENQQNTNAFTAAASSGDSGLSLEFVSDSSASLANIFNEKSVKSIQIFSLSFFILVCGLLSTDFGISISTILDSSDRIGYMDKGFEILSTIVYTKFYLSEVIFSGYEEYQNVANPFNLEGGKEEYIKTMKQEMANCRETFSSTYSHFSNATVDFSDNYQKYTEETQVYITTLSSNEITREHQPFATAMSRIPTSIFYVSTVTDSSLPVDMNDRNALELMENLLNDYLLVWRNATFFLVDDVLDNAVASKSLAFIYGLSFLIAIVALFVIWKLINKFIEDREKPIDLFLTIKKRRFSELKERSDNFTNKLLNKFFGNEDAEEESVVEVTNNIKADDINIIKFKTKTEYKQTLKSSREYLINYFKLVIFFAIIQGYLTFKFCYNRNAMTSVNNFTKVFNITHYSQSDLILSLDIVKSFFFDPTIPIFNVSKDDEIPIERKTEQIFKNTFIDISNTFEDLLLTTYSTDCFLKGQYISKFYDLLNKNITHLVTIDTYTNSKGELEVRNYLGTLKNGFKSTLSRYFELIRFIGISYFNGPHNCSTLIKSAENTTSLNEYIYMNEYLELNSIAKNVIRPWYIYLLKEINSRFDEYITEVQMVNIATFVVVLGCVVLLYCLVWKSYEEHLKTLLRTSVDLINLIPEEIKYQIVQKLNEEDNKAQ